MHLRIENIFGVMVIIFLILAIVVLAIVFNILKKKGIDIYSSKVQLKVILYVLPIALLPLWFDPRSSIKVKVIGSIIAVVVAVINFTAVDRGGKILRHILGIKDK